MSNYHSRKRTIGTPKWYQQASYSENTSIDGTYMGIVRDTRDPQKMGRLLVWIPELAGDGDKEENWFICAYCSPFAGSSFLDTGIYNDPEGAPVKQILGDQSIHRNPQLQTNDKTKRSGRQSYGMWFTPPDIGNEVIVTFLNGNPNRGIWMGCLFAQNMDFMVPGIAQDQMFEENADFGGSPEQGPVIEYDQRFENGSGNPGRLEYTPLNSGLINQGLDVDTQRGQSTSSARREAPSQVFGILTPDGNSFVLDDLQDEELIRLRTKSGAQLLIHQTSGYIYAVSRDGLTWIELSNEGDIDIYGQANVSIHSEKANVNLKAGKDVNIESDGNINIRAKKNIKIQADEQLDINVTNDIRITSIDSKISVDSGTEVAIRSGSDFGITAGGDIREQAANVFMNSGLGPQPDASLSPETYRVPRPPTQPPEGQRWAPGENYEDGENIIPRVPQHEPWTWHNISTRGTTGHVVEGELGPERPGATSTTATKPNDITLPDGTRLEGTGYTAQNVPECVEVGTVPPGSLKPTSQLQISQSGVDLIKQFEGSKNNVYKDIAGLDTIGVGHLITTKEKADGTFSSGVISDSEVDALLLQDLSSTQKAIRGCVKQPLTQEQYDSLVSLAFNIGSSGFCNSTLVKKINEADYKAVPNQMLRWNKARVGGVLQPSKGLTNRRIAEANLFAKAPIAA